MEIISVTQQGQSHRVRRRNRGPLYREHGEDKLHLIYDAYHGHRWVRGRLRYILIHRDQKRRNPYPLKHVSERTLSASDGKTCFVIISEDKYDLEIDG